MGTNKKLKKQIPIIITEVDFGARNTDTIIPGEHDQKVNTYPSSYGTPYGGPQSQSIVPGSTGYGGAPGIRTDNTPYDYGMTSGGK